jgi:energy-coupling factor transporter ATP-binding protein EcfA2
MRLLFISPHKSIRGEVTEGEIADFVVLSGPNGSGKSNLLEAINSGAVEIEGIKPGEPPQNVRLFGVAQLAISPQGPDEINVRVNSWEQFQRIIKSLVTETTGGPARLETGSDEQEEAIRNLILQRRVLTEAALDQVVGESGKRLIDFERDDFRRASPDPPPNARRGE